ncbi:acyl-CoA dehydrogenase family protein [Streptomyces sp. NPDC007162]|uniref:acyl-CoA dehydrogenase family protein n=1 Tax=Streptomyces sp. NPDC007162 TaxID=3156917 RepID=UPI003401B634
MSAPTVEAARALRPLIRAARQEIDDGQTVPRHLVDALRDIGIWRMTQPRAWGGPEVDLVSQFEIIEALAEADGSVGWVAYIGSASGYYTAYLDDAAGRELYPDLDLITGGSPLPRGTAVAVDGGYRFTGQWPFGSGVCHSDYMVSGCVVVDDDGNPKVDASGIPEAVVGFLPASEVKIIYNWNTLGLRGTGSHDYAAEDAFVPSKWTFSLGSPLRRAGALYSMPNMLQLGHSAIPLGLARAAIDEAGQILRSKTAVFTGVKLAESGIVRDAVARAETMVEAARSLCLQTFAGITDTIERGEKLSVRQRAMFRLAIAHAHESGVEAIRLVTRHVGTGAVRTPGIIERALRDAVTAGQHNVASPAVYESAGAMFLGSPPPPMF